jgi:hypothetical protein
MCAPDLLRYCKNNTGTIISGLFARCGLDYSTSSGGDVSGVENIYSVGLNGRIVPYLLQPISNITGAYELFRFCRMLSSYQTSSGNIYLIPPTFFSYAPKITDLRRTFQGLSMIFGTRMDVFSPLTGALDIRCIFANVAYGSNSSGGTNTYSSIFASNNISKISGAFSYYDLTIDGSTLGVYVTDANSRTTGINDSIRFSNNFNSSKIPAAANTGYVYYGWGTGRVTEPSIANNNGNY